MATEDINRELGDYEFEWEKKARAAGAYLFKPWLTEDERKPGDPPEFYRSAYWPYPDRNPLGLYLHDYWMPKAWPDGYGCHAEALAKAPERCRRAGVESENMEGCVEAQKGALRHQFSIYVHNETANGKRPMRKFDQSLYNLTVDGPRGIMRFAATFECGGMTRLMGGGDVGERQREACLSSIRASIHDAAACIKSRRV